MKKRIAATITFVVMAAACALPAYAAQTKFRSTTSYSVQNYSNSINGKVTESAFSAKVEPDVTLLVRVYRDDRRTWANNIYTTGGTIVLNKHDYVELTYGYGHDSNKATSNHYAADFTHETANYLLGIGIRRSMYPGYRVTILSPGGKWYLSKDFSLLSKLFYSIGTGDQKNYAWWTEGEYAINPRTKIKLGFTTGDRLYDTELGAAAGGSHHSWLTGVSYDINSRSSVKLMYEGQTRKDLYKVQKSTLVYDVKF